MAEAEAEGAAAAVGRAELLPCGEGLWAGQGGSPGSPYSGESASWHELVSHKECT